jgi:hypothetical protein
MLLLVLTIDIWAFRVPQALGLPDFSWIFCSLVKFVVLKMNWIVVWSGEGSEIHYEEGKTHMIIQWSSL